MRVSDAIGDWFAARGIQHYFGYSGAAVLPLLDGLVGHPEIQGIQPKHESHAVHMADTYYRITGRLAPVVVTKGPGILNCVGGLATAQHDTSAVMLIAGGSPTHHFGKSLQELSQHGFEDVANVLRPVVKRAWLQVRPDTVLDTLNQAYKIATTGRPGPVFIYLPLDILQVEVEPEREIVAPRGVTSRLRPDEDSITAVVKLLGEAERPVLVAGGGVGHSPGGIAALQSFVEQVGMPVVTTLTAKGVLSEDHPLSLGPVGRSGSAAAASATRQSDLVLAFGARFADGHTSNWRSGRVYNVPGTKVVQVDVDISEIGRTYPVEVGILGDAEAVLSDLSVATRNAGFEGRWSSWVDELSNLKKSWLEEIAPVTSSSASPIHPARVMAEVGDAIASSGRVYIDIGDSISYAEAYMTIRRPGSWCIMPGMAEMGSAASGVLGAAVADPSQPAIAVTGDGAFNMVSNILGAAVEYDLPAIWVIMNNCELGIERKSSELLFGRMHPWAQFVRKDTGEPYNPDFVKLAEAYGALGERVERAEDLKAALGRAIASRRPYVLDVVTDPSPPTFFTPGIERSYPNKWAETYPQYMDLHIVSK
jgi:acetolactate synthase I/II/III large subunit